MADPIPKELWYDKAWALAIGDTTEGKHPSCANSGGEDRDVLYIYHNTAGVGAYCNRCHGKAFEPHGTMSLEELEAIAEAERSITEDVSEVVSLPQDASEEFDLWATVWFLKAGITTHQALDAGFRFGMRSKRVYLPVYDPDTSGHNRTLVYYQARLVNGTGPKYLNPKSGKEDAVPFYTPTWWPQNGQDLPVRLHADGTGLHQARTTCDAVLPEEALLHPRRVCGITEDIASAVRVGRSIPCIAALGTHLNSAALRWLAQFDYVIIWTDSDRAGQDGREEMVDLLEWGPTVLHIETPKDPKAYSFATINQYIKEVVP